MASFQKYCCYCFLLVLQPSLYYSSSSKLLARRQDFRECHQMTNLLPLETKPHIAPKERVFVTAGTMNTDPRRASRM